MNLIILLALIAIGYIMGTAAERGHYRSIEKREAETIDLPVLNIGKMKEERPIEGSRLVTGSVVISIDYFKRIVAQLINIVGGKVISYESLVDRARREAILRMKEQAGGADYIMNLRVETSTIGNSANQKNGVGSVEVLAYGTAVKVRKMNLNYKQPDASVNVSKVSPLKRFMQLMLGLLLTLVAIYAVLGILIDLLAPHIPKTAEIKMGSAILSEWTVVDDDPVLESYEAILIKLVGEIEAEKYHIRILEDKTLNAFAIPGNIIGFTTEFVEEIDDEEMIAFALAHELGHFENRDHIKGYGRLMVLYGLVNLVTDDGSLSKLVLDILSKTEMKFSQKGELAADAYGASLVEVAYGSSQGGIDFFKEMSAISERSQLKSYFDSHPHPEKE